MAYFRCSSGSGSSGTPRIKVTSLAVNSSNKATWSGLTVGKTYHVAINTWGNDTSHTQGWCNITAMTGGTYSQTEEPMTIKRVSGTDANTSSWRWYDITPTGTSVTITLGGGSSTNIALLEIE